MVYEFNGVNRYHATAVESGDHLARCMVYIDKKMVRAGVVNHPSMWPFCGYNEIQHPRRRNVLIDYEMLAGLIGNGSYEQLRSSHKGWVEEYLGNAAKARQDEWTSSIAAGSKSFVETIKERLGFKAIGRDIQGGEGAYQLRESAALYGTHFKAEKVVIGPENTYFWDLRIE